MTEKEIIKDAYSEIKELAAVLIIDKQERAALREACTNASIPSTHLEDPFAETSPELIEHIEKCAAARRRSIKSYEDLVARMGKHVEKAGLFANIGFEAYFDKDHLKQTSEKILAIANEAANKVVAEELKWEAAYEIVFKKLGIETGSNSHVPTDYKQRYAEAYVSGATPSKSNIGPKKAEG